MNKKVNSLTRYHKKTSIHCPRVSVIVPCYNQAKYLKECLDSVMAQTFQDFEVIVVDDGSTDHENKEILKSLEYPKTRIIHQTNKGLVGARNTGITEAKGQYILPLDADDKIAPYVLEKAVEILDKNPDVGIVGGTTVFFGTKEGIFKLPLYQFPNILTQNCFVCSCMFRRSDWKKVGGYNSNMIYGLEDWDFWLSLIELGRKVYQFNETFLYYRQHHVSMITGLKGKQQQKMVRQLILNHSKLYQEYPKQRRKLLRIHGKCFKLIRFLVKMTCCLIPIKSWRYKLRSYYR